MYTVRQIYRPDQINIKIMHFMTTFSVNECSTRSVCNNQFRPVDGIILLLSSHIHPLSSASELIVTCINFCCHWFISDKAHSKMVIVMNVLLFLLFFLFTQKPQYTVAHLPHCP